MLDPADRRRPRRLPARRRRRRAVAAGLTFRPLAETARDVPEWTGKAGLAPGARGGAARRLGEAAGVSLDVAAARARFSALQRDLVFFDGPGGTQVPDEVIEAVSDYFRTSNANTSGPYETSRRTEALDERLARDRRPLPRLRAGTRSSSART